MSISHVNLNIWFSILYNLNIISLPEPPDINFDEISWFVKDEFDLVIISKNLSNFNILVSFTLHISSSKNIPTLPLLSVE